VKNIFPELRTNRLVLRKFTLEDVDDVSRLVSAGEIAESTFIPHPYEEGMAEDWIKNQHLCYITGLLMNFAITLADKDKLIGSAGLTFEQNTSTAQLGFWIGVPYWGKGYCTEACEEVLKYGFEVLGLKKIDAFHLSGNNASGRVLQKIGMKHIGTRSKHFFHRGKYKDSEIYYIEYSDYIRKYIPSRSDS